MAVLTLVNNKKFLTCVMLRKFDLILKKSEFNFFATETFLIKRTFCWKIKFIQKSSGSASPLLCGRLSQSFKHNETYLALSDQSLLYSVSPKMTVRLCMVINSNLMKNGTKLGSVYLEFSKMSTIQSMYCISTSFLQ